MSHQSRRTFVKHVGAAAGSGLLFGAGSAATDASEPEPGQVRFERSVPVARAYDVVVCGGGPSGCAAALAAKREGLTRALGRGPGAVGRHGHLGHGLPLAGRTQPERRVGSGRTVSLHCQRSRRAGDMPLLPRLDPAKKYHPFGWYNWFIHGVPLDPYGIAPAPG